MWQNWVCYQEVMLSIYALTQQTRERKNEKNKKPHPSMFQCSSHKIFPLPSHSLDGFISSLLIDNLYDWSPGPHLLLLNVKGECSWPLCPSLAHLLATCGDDKPAFHPAWAFRLSKGFQQRAPDVNSCSFDTLAFPSLLVWQCITVVWRWQKYGQISFLEGFNMSGTMS